MESALPEKPMLPLTSPEPGPPASEDAAFRQEQQPAGNAPTPCSGPALSPPPNATQERRGARAAEVDLWWGSYASRTMLPSFVLCVFLTGAIADLAWLLGAWHGSALIRSTA